MANKQGKMVPLLLFDLDILKLADWFYIAKFGTITSPAF